MRRRQSIVFGLVVVLSSLLLASGEERRAAAAPVSLMERLGHHHHPIQTRNPEAQRFFDQGLTLIYGFNHEEAIRSFRRAAALDPEAAMPLWGIAYALGPNINRDVDPEREKAAFDAVQRALKLAKTAVPNERAYIEVLARRYSEDPRANLQALAADFAKAMGELSRRYPDDLDLATLYAESLMDLRPWRLWSLEGKPAEGTEEIVAVLESVLRRAPGHVGANHYYIHAVEASLHPERGLPSAKRLETLAPAAGHLVHMPAHIYMRVGDYDAAARRNSDAAKVDREYLRETATGGSFYDLMYYAHNLHFLAAAHAAAGRSADALKAADDLVAHVGPLVEGMPMGEFYLPTPYFVRLRFQRWDQILKTPAPDPKWVMTTSFWHLARGVASAARGEVAAAEAERRAIAAAALQIPEDAEFSAYFNKARHFLDLALATLDARIAEAKGERSRAIELWGKAVDLGDRLNYGEPPEWYYPVRESLGGALLRSGRAVEAEKVFREDLERNPRNPRSLFGLWRSLEAQKRAVDAGFVKQQFDAAWAGAETELRLEDL
ncbi:MAG: tetratricopeptide repeat protein [Thermoanaerobaculia bacterium]